MAALTALFVYEDQALTHKIVPGAGKAELLTVFRDLYGVQSNIIIQHKDCNWDTWVNIGSDYKLYKEKTQLRMIRSPKQKLLLGNLSPSSSAVFCCDMQERFRPAIKYFDEIVSVASRVLKAAEILKIPLIVTEEYPKGLGKTVSQLDISHASLVAEKTKFSMLVPVVESKLDNVPEVGSIILFGVEAHVCVQQTVLDLIARGFDVHVVADATSSRSAVDRRIAFERLRRMGAFITTSETVLLQLVADKNHEHFKAIQGLIKELPPHLGL